VKGHRRRCRHRRAAPEKTQARYGIQQDRSLRRRPSGRGDEQGWRIHVSAKTGAGFDALRHALLALAGWQSGEKMCSWRANGTSSPSSESPRRSSGPTDDATERTFCRELRLAQRELGSITGEFSADDLLGQIFARFCVGK